MATSEVHILQAGSSNLPCATKNTIIKNRKEHQHIGVCCLIVDQEIVGSNPSCSATDFGAKLKWHKRWVVNPKIGSSNLSVPATCKKDKRKRANNSH